MIRISWRYATGRRFQYVFVCVCFVLANLVSLLEPAVLGLFFNHLQEYGLEGVKQALMILAIHPALRLLFWVFHGTARIMERVTAYHIVKNFRAELFDVLTGLPLSWHKDHHSGEIMSRLEKGSAALRSYSEESFLYYEVVVKFIGSAAALFFLSFYAGLISLGFGLFAALIIFRFDKLLMSYITRINELWHVYDSTFYDYIANVRTVITLRLEKLAKSETVQRLTMVFPTWKRNAQVNELKWFLLTMVISFCVFAVLASYLFQKLALGEALMLGTLVALYEYVGRFTGAFFDLAWKYESLMRYNTDLQSLKPIWAAGKRFGARVKAQPIPVDWKTLQIRGLHFRYEDETKRKHNLKNVNLDLRRGERIAFVGESGSGKSTMMTLLRGLQEPQKGQLLADGQRTSGLHALSDHVTLIPQDPEIFENTIEYNVTAGIHHRKPEVENAIKATRFGNVLKRLPKGLKMNIKEKGVNLSGGEKQRLALARGVFAAKNSSLVLLDEPTSSVDPANELKIYENLFGLFKDKCVVSSVHRLHLLPRFDRIYFFHEGEVLAEGNFDELLKSCPEFLALWKVYQKSVKHKHEANLDS